MRTRFAHAGRALTLRRQLLLTFGLLVTVVLVAALVSLGGLATVDEADKRIAEHTAPYVTTLSAARPGVPNSFGRAAYFSSGLSRPRVAREEGVTP